MVTGPLEFVEAAHKQAEQTAQRAHGTWEGVAEGWRIRIVDELGRTVVHLPIRLSSEDPTGDYATATHIENHDPAAVLRRVAAERKLLALRHPNEHYPDDCYDCRREPGWQYGTPADRPCVRVRALAEGWGWKENGQ